MVQRAQGAPFLRDLNARLGKHRHLLSAAFGLADAAVAPFVRQFAHTDPAWFAGQPWPALHQWLAAFEESSNYARVMVKFAAWTEGQSVQLFPA